METKKVIIGMSGGVDSSVAACLLKEKGYQVIGATMKLLDNDETNIAIQDAKKICKQLNIPHHIFDLRKEFKEIVIKQFIDSYESGKTPNPCIICNKYFKFGLFYKKAKELNCTFIATGHYAKIKNNRLMMSNVDGKDQSYFLCQINKDLLPYILFPLNKYKTKDEIRQLARKYNLPVSEKKDSQEICFIPKDDYKTFLKKHKLNQQPGKIILKDKTPLATHNGLYQYTIGQRKGLNISYKEPLYVIELDKINNNIIVGSNKDLERKTLIAEGINYLVEKDAFLKEKKYAKIRSRSNLEEIEKIEEKNNQLLVTFKNKQRAITPGQFIVFYNSKKECLGGASIIK
ncbi:MAG TPA: tRNA 2-thiouridine(34) synthase MnmA [Candidatus Faecimonas gallistercoris]|nr:tRNA 2-thiouridine(34) synthase MnmA [Candidatus Faecimonas gallistercoris]